MWKTQFFSGDHLDKDSPDNVSAIEDKIFPELKQWILQGLSQIKKVFLGEIQIVNEIKLGPLVRPQDSWSMALGDKELPSVTYIHSLYFEKRDWGDVTKQKGPIALVLRKVIDIESVQFFMIVTKRTNYPTSPQIFLDGLIRWVGCVFTICSSRLGLLWCTRISLGMGILFSSNSFAIETVSHEQVPRTAFSTNA